MDGGDAARVVGDRPVPTRRSRRIQLVWILALLGLLTWQLWRGEGTFVLLWLLFPVSAWVMGARPATTVDADGIHRPWRIRRAVSWSEVDAVMPGEGFPARVTILLTTGRTITLDDVPAERAAQVAEVGGKPVRRPAPLSSPRPAPVPREPSDAERTADVDRRSSALARQRAELDAQARLRLRGLPRSAPPP